MWFGKGEVMLSQLLKDRYTEQLINQPYNGVKTSLCLHTAWPQPRNESESAARALLKC